MDAFQPGCGFLYVFELETEGPVEIRPVVSIRGCEKVNQRRRVEGGARAGGGLNDGMLAEDLEGQRAEQIERLGYPRRNIWRS